MSSKDRIENTAEKIINSLKPELSGKERAMALYGIMLEIEYVLDDAFKLYKNINDTSLPGHDRKNRVVELSSKFSIQLTHLI